ncbi:WhiB family transcriptional regulator [Streptomyces mirabilis]
MSYTGSTPDTEPAGQWLKRAACLGLADEMFPDNNEQGIAHAKAICRPCPVQTECVLDALNVGDYKYGIRGGLRPNERRNLARQLMRHQRTVTDPDGEEPRPERTFQSLWAERTELLDNGHMMWTASEPVALNGRYYTPRKIGFRVDRGHPPVGIVRRTCDVDGCVLPAHLMDQAERDAHRGASV